MLKLIIALVAGAFAIASFPAVAFDIPDYGSKNFSPSGDTPTYFANEAAPVSARTADTTESDWSDVDAAAPSRETGEVAPRRYVHRGRHGRYVSVHGSSRHSAPRARANAYSTHSNRPVPAVSARPGRPARSALVHAAAAPNRGRTTGMRHSRAIAHHVSDGLSYSASKSGVVLL